MAKSDKWCIGGGTEPVTCVYINTTIAGGQTVKFPTVQKAKGISVRSSDGYYFFATDDMATAYMNGAVAPTYVMTFSDNEVNFGRPYGTSAYGFQGYYWY